MRPSRAAGIAPDRRARAMHASRTGSGNDMSTRTTVVIATRNRCDELLRTLGKLRELRPRPPIIVVDNGSADGTTHTVRERFPDVCVIRAPRNFGALARNIGALCVRTPYIAFSDDDSWWDENALPRAEDILDRHPSVGLIAARTLVGEHERPDPVNELMAQSPLETPQSLPGPRILGFTACSAVVRREAFRGVGGFNPALFFVAEEKMLAYDLAAAGWDLVYVDRVLAHHHPSQARQSTTSRRALELRNNLLLGWMRRPPRVAFAQTVRLAREAVSDAHSRRAALGALRRLPPALLRRRRLPSHVEREVVALEAIQGA
jgi:GT2 family glycosyltransferase